MRYFAYASNMNQRKLKENGEKLVAAREQEAELQEQLAKLPRLEEQAKQFDAIGLDAKLRLVPLLEKERQLSPRIQEELERVSSGLGTLRDSLPDTTFLNEKALENLPHANVAARARAVLEGVKSRVEQLIDAATADLRTATAVIAATIAELEQARRQAEASLEKDFATLPDVAGKKGPEVGRTYQALQREIETIRPQQSRLHAVAELLAALDQDRRNFRGELSDLRHDRTLALEKAVKALNKKLAGKLRLEVAPGADRQALKDFLTGLRGIGERTLSWVDTAVDLTIPALVEACRGGTAALLAKGWGVTPARAEAICNLSHAELLALETIDLEDRVELELNVAHEGETYRPLQRLSTGQQCTAILHLLLLDNTDPLVMDQPEDNLDNAFIADRIVRELRSEKTSRQFIFATHNANIPVFGDAEWIGVCIADGQHGGVPHGNQGSIDVPNIRDEAARILDGGREAFLQRQEKYGY